tara:strand:+ start:2843 stop:3010 length:168 start_codon:yes stop_codon:yes gene_type:complete
MEEKNVNRLTAVTVRHSIEDCWGVVKLADTPSCLDGASDIARWLGGSNPSPPAIL